MDEDLKEKIQDIYDKYLKDDPNFQKFYSNYKMHEARQSDHGADAGLTRSIDGHQKKFEAPSVTAEAAQTQEKKPEVVKEKERTIGDIINTPRNQDELVISAAAKSGLLNEKEIKDVGKEKATSTNLNKLVTQLEERAIAVALVRDLQKHYDAQMKEANKKEAAAQAKEHKAEEKKEKPKKIEREFGVTEAVTKSIREKEVLGDAIDTLKKSGVSTEKSSDGPMSTPKDARDKAQQAKGGDLLPKKT